MVAGMAATSPIAVANRASAMPGATTASDVFFEAAIDWKLVMMPQTFDLPHDGNVHHLLDAHLQSCERTRWPFETAFPFLHGSNKQCSHGVIRPRRHHAVEFLQRLP